MNLPLLLPDVSHPIIVEVMTASTSGSNKEKETNISSAFSDALLKANHTAPGINKRQVWGRMVTQLFSKTALTKVWGGQTVWVVQDELLKNIESTTRLNTDALNSDDTNTIRSAIMHYETPETDNAPRKMAFRELRTGSAGLDFAGNDTFTDILLPKRVPSKSELLKAILRRRIAGRIKL